MNRRSLRSLRLTPAVTAMAILALLAVAGPANAAATAKTATVTILHGLPDFTADVYVNGALTLDAFEPETATDPLSLPAGDYDVAIRDAGSPADSTPALEATVTLKSGKNYSAIAHLSPTGDPTLTLFENDLSTIPAGKARVVARNAADVSAVGVSLDGKMVFEEVTADQEGTANRTPGRHTVAVTSADDGSELIPETSLSLKEGTSTIVYLVGSLAGGSLDLMVQDLTDLSTEPVVGAGSGGQAAPGGMPGWVVAMSATAAVGATASTVVIVCDRRRGRATT